jgi:hypothetical protein
MNTFCLCTEIWEYLLEEIFRCIAFSQWQKANGFTKGRIVVFILEPNNTKLLDDFAFGPQLGVDGIIGQ